MCLQEGYGGIYPTCPTAWLSWVNQTLEWSIAGERLLSCACASVGSGGWLQADQLDGQSAPSCQCHSTGGTFYWFHLVNLIWTIRILLMFKIKPSTQLIHTHLFSFFPSGAGVLLHFVIEPPNPTKRSTSMMHPAFRGFQLSCLVCVPKH